MPIVYILFVPDELVFLSFSYLSETQQSSPGRCSCPCLLLLLHGGGGAVEEGGDAGLGSHDSQAGAGADVGADAGADAGADVARRLQCPD